MYLRICAITIFFLLMGIDLFSQQRFAGYISHQRDETNLSPFFFHYSFFIKIIIPQNVILPDSLSSSNSRLPNAYFDSETTINGSKSGSYYSFKKALSGTSIFVLFSHQFKNAIYFNNFTEDSIDILNLTGKLIIPMNSAFYRKSSIDTSMPVNIDFPLTIKKEEGLRFNPYNLHPDVEFFSYHKDFPDFMDSLDLEFDSFSTEIFFKPKDTGNFLICSNILMYDFSTVSSWSFYTVHVVDNQEDIPSGYFTYQDKSYEDQFFTINPFSQNKVDLQYHSQNADSVNFQILPLDMPYKGFYLNQSKSGNDYDVEVLWDEKAFILKKERSFINLLVSRYKKGKPYYETFTVNFDSTLHSTGISSPNEKIKISLFPNPVNDQYFYLKSSNEELPFQARIYNAKGQNIKSFQVTESLTNIELDVPTGLYLIQLQNEKGQKTVKLLKE